MRPTMAAPSSRSEETVARCLQRSHRLGKVERAASRLMFVIFTAASLAAHRPPVLPLSDERSLCFLHFKCPSLLLSSPCARSCATR